MPIFRIEDFIRQELGDRDTEDYFSRSGELEAICWRFVVCRTTRITLSLTALETRMTPLPTPGVSSIGTFWAYCLGQYIPNIWSQILATCAFDQRIHQPNHRYGLFQANAYVDGVFSAPQPEIDEVALLAEFPTDVSGAVTLTGYSINLNRIMHTIFTAIADDVGKLAVYQSTIGGATDLRDAARIAQGQAAKWIRGSAIQYDPLKGGRRNRF